MSEYGNTTDDSTLGHKPLCNSSGVTFFGRVLPPTLYSLVFILGFLGNALVVCVLVKYRRHANMTDVCLLNLAVADLLFVLSLPFMASITSLGRWIFGDFLCRLTSGLYILGFYGSIFSLVTMTLDRYVVVVHGQTKAAYRHSAKTCVAVTMLVWLFSLLASLPNLAFHQTSNETTECLRYPQDTYWRQFTLLEMNVLGLLLPLLVMVACYSRIIPVLLNMRTSKKHRAVRLLLLLILVFFLFWTPYNVALLFYVLQMRGHFPRDCGVSHKIKLAVRVTHVISFTHCSLNPIMYAFTGQKFVQRVQTLLKMWLPRYGNTTDDYGDYYSDSSSGHEPPCNSSGVIAFGRVFLPTLYSLVFILGFLGNALVVCVLVKYRRHANMTDVCLLNLAVADLLFVVALPLMGSYASLGRWIFGGFLCRLTYSFFVLGFYGSILFLVAMTLDRYVVIVHAHTAAAHRRSKRTGAVVSLVVWLLSALASLPILAFVQTEGGHGPTCAPAFPKDAYWRQFVSLEMNVLGLLLPLLVMVACYSRILPTLVSMRSSKRHRAVRLILLIVVVFFLFWAPYNVAVFLKVLEKNVLHDCEESNSINVALQVTETIAFSHCCLNPIIYAFAGQKFMRRALSLLKRWLPHWCFPAQLSRELSERALSVMSRSSEGTSTVVV
ncbi:uncharacterized protein FYW47_006871 [Aplochiton taeniatus]